MRVWLLWPAGTNDFWVPSMTKAAAKTTWFPCEKVPISQIMPRLHPIYTSMWQSFSFHLNHIQLFWIKLLLNVTSKGLRFPPIPTISTSDRLFQRIETINQQINVTPTTYRSPAWLIGELYATPLKVKFQRVLVGDHHSPPASTPQNKETTSSIFLHTVDGRNLHQLLDGLFHYNPIMYSVSELPIAKSYLSCPSTVCHSTCSNLWP